MTSPRLSLAALTPEELTEQLSLDQPFRGSQIFRWIHAGRLDFTSMSDLPHALRSRLTDTCTTMSSRIAARVSDRDGTRKYGISLSDGNRIESVVLQDENGRKTACLSSQVGCGMGCGFCSTGKMGLKRDLGAHEIVEQLLLLEGDSDAPGRRGIGENRRPSIANVVFMGMGEPLENLANVRKAISIMCHALGLGMSPRRITVSTCGIPAGIRELARSGPRVRLSLSLVSAQPQVRERLMPVARRHSLPELKQALTVYQAATRRRITLDLVLLAGITDTAANADAVARFLSPLKAAINLIPWNPDEALPFAPPSPAAIRHFSAYFEKRGLPATRRFRRGAEINAACGQLFAFQNGSDTANARR